MNDITEPITEPLTVPGRPGRHRRRLGRLALSLTSLAATLVLGCAVVAASVFISNRTGGEHRNFFTDITQPSGGAGYSAADGYIPDGQPLRYDSDVPALSRLDPALRAALISAARAAHADGVTIAVTSGWRSAQLQQALLSEAVAQQGVDNARRLVKSPAESEHVTGRAVDVGPTEAAAWMSRYGSEFGLCQTYANELWHYELTAINGDCPAMKADAAS